mgnify:CR=1 FL=1
MSMLTLDQEELITFNVMITMKAQPYRSLRMWVVNYYQKCGRREINFFVHLRSRYSLHSVLLLEIRFSRTALQLLSPHKALARTTRHWNFPWRPTAVI